MIVLNDDEIREIVKDEVDKSVRKRIKEMQSGYTSKYYLEGLITEILWSVICEKIPNIEMFLRDKIDDIFEIEKNHIEKINKRQLVNLIVDELLEQLE